MTLGIIVLGIAILGSMEDIIAGTTILGTSATLGIIILGIMTLGATGLADIMTLGTITTITVLVLLVLGYMATTIMALVVVRSLRASVTEGHSRGVVIPLPDFLQVAITVLQVQPV